MTRTPKWPRLARDDGGLAVLERHVDALSLALLARRDELAELVAGVAPGAGR